MSLKITDTTEEILDLFQEHGNLTTGAIAEFSYKTRQTVTRHLRQLEAADCIEYLHEDTALWQLVDDPRR